MRAYIRNWGNATEQQAKAIFIHLRGRAKDIVKFGMKNCGIDAVKNPEAIYGLLLNHFDSVLCSSLLLADFYTIFPKADKDGSGSIRL